MLSILKYLIFVIFLMGGIQCKNSSLDPFPDEFVGIGIELEIKDSLVKIKSVFTGSNADLAGLENQDLLLKINGQSTYGKNLAQIVNEIRGEPGSQLKILVKRKSGAKKTYIIVRSKFIRINEEEKEKKKQYIER